MPCCCGASNNSLEAAQKQGVMNSKQYIIAVTGGIGAGKSVVCRVLRALGYPVFDCDSEAKSLMDSDKAIKDRLAREISADVILADGSIDRRRLARIVFADAARLDILNSIVHGAVRERIAAWASAQSSKTVFVETAILFQSGLNRMVDEEWRVEAPLDMRVERVMARNSMSRSEVEARIAAQNFEVAPGEPEPRLVVLNNDERSSLLFQILVSTRSLEPDASVRP